MKVLVACEYSGIVRDAFTKAGHHAVSCDLLPSETDHGEHYQGSVLDILNDGWNLYSPRPILSQVGLTVSTKWHRGQPAGESVAGPIKASPMQWPTSGDKWG